MKRTRYASTALGVGLGLLLLLATSGTDRALAHKEKHTPDQLKAFDDVFMEQVKVGDLLFHGDGATEKKLGVTLRYMMPAGGCCFARNVAGESFSGLATDCTVRFARRSSV